MNVFDYELNSMCLSLHQERRFKPEDARILTITIKCKRRKGLVTNLFVTDYKDYPNYADAIDTIAARLCYEKKCELVQDVKISVSGFNTIYTRSILTTVEMDLPNVEEYEPTNDFKESLEKLMWEKIEYYKHHSVKPEYVSRMNENYGRLTLLALYIKYVGSISHSYGRYIDHPERYDGFIHDDEFIYIRRKQFIKFMSFMLQQDIQLKPWLNDFIETNKKYMSESHLSGKGTRLIKIRKNFANTILEVKFDTGHGDMSKIDLEYVNYISTEIRIYKQSLNSI